LWHALDAEGADLGPVHKLLDCARAEPDRSTKIITFDDDMVRSPRARPARRELDRRAGGAESAHKAGAAPAACGAAARVLRAAPLCSGWLFRLERLSRPPRAKPPRLRARRLCGAAPCAPPCPTLQTKLTNPTPPSPRADAITAQARSERHPGDTGDARRRRG
jgi:hypothetical protein